MRKSNKKTKSHKPKSRKASLKKSVNKLRKKLPAKRKPIKKQVKHRIARKSTLKRFSIPERWSSSVLGYYTSHCIKALDFHLRGEFRETDQFQVGIAAHAVLQECGRRGLTDYDTIKEVANEVVKVLVTKWRSFYGKLEPPVKPDYAMQGRDLAIQFMLFNPLPLPAQYEVTFSIDKKGEPCKFDDTRFSSKIDCMYFTDNDDESFQGEIVVVRDWKSAWSSGEADLDTLQRHIQAVMGWLHHGKNRVGVRTEVVNLRTGRVFSRLIL